MAKSQAAKPMPAEEAEHGPSDEKRQHVLAQLMAAIWHRHNAANDLAPGDSEQQKRKDYLADIW